MGCSYPMFGMFSPRPWGCTGISADRRNADGVFPTPVGVYRRLRYLVADRLSFPHARGGVPAANAAKRFSFAFSPRPWGCTDCIIYTSDKNTSFPHARGGVPIDELREAIERRFPHARGGVPGDARINRKGRPFSPRPWGCTAPSLR